MYRLQKLLSRIGYCSRRSAEQLIETGQVKINGNLAKIGDKCRVDDILEVSGIPIDIKNAFNQNTQIIKYYKPIGEVVSRKDTHNLNSVFDYLPSVKGKWINIGRLDIKTSGLILFTNNGDLAHKLMHPSFSFLRKYLVHTDKPLSNLLIEKLLKGVPINDGEVGKFDEMKKCSKNIYEIILSTGKNTEIRNSLKYLKINTLKLHRISYSAVKLEDMKEGEFRHLTLEEKTNFSI